MRKIHVGVVGAGWWATDNHLPVLRALDTVEIVGVCDSLSDRAEAVRNRFGIPYATDDYRQLLALPELEAIVVCSPHDAHYDHAWNALTSGRHVLCEKPMCLHAAQAWALVQEAERRNLHLLVPYAWNYTDVAIAARRAVDDGMIGRPIHVQCHMASALRDLFDGQGAWFATQSLIKPNMATWSDPHRGGGYAHGQLTHLLGLLFETISLEPEQVTAWAAPSATGADLSICVSCRFAGGVTGSISGCGTMPPGSPFQVEMRIFGAEGMLLLDIERPRLEVRRFDGRNHVFPTTLTPGEYPQEEPVKVFVDLIRGTGVRNRSEARVGALSVAVIEAALDAAATGTTQEIASHA